MSQSLARAWLHVVFSTKDRQAFLQHNGFRDEMCRLLGYHINEIGCRALRAGAWIDHVLRTNSVNYVVDTNWKLMSIMSGT